MRRMMLSNQVLEVTAVGMQTCFNATLHVVEVTSPLSRRMLSSSAARVRGLFPYTVPFNMPHRKKSGVKCQATLVATVPSRRHDQGKKTRLEPCLFWKCEFFLHERDRCAPFAGRRETRLRLPFL